MPENRPLDPEKLKSYSKGVFGALGGAMTASMIHLGDRLGLYPVLAESGAVTRGELAARTGLDERWLLGTLGLPPALAREMTEAAGFTRFEEVDFGHPVNAF
jgi:hypothetical protein